MITIFKNYSDINNPNYITVEQALERIRQGKSKERIEQIRKKVISGESYDQDKEQLPFIVFSAGKVQPIEITKNDKTYKTCRLDKSVVTHSGVFVLDWDKCDVVQRMEQLRNDPYIYAAWLAPSGKGIKALVKCPTSIENHSLYYTAFLDRYEGLDPTSRNISRGTYESYDPNIFINPNPLIWDKRMKEEDRKRNREKIGNRRATQVISTAVGMVRASMDGEKHDTLLKAAKLLGGYVATGRIKEEEAIQVLETEISHKNIQDLPGAKRTILDGLAYGKAQPLVESKKIEKSQKFLRRPDGTYDFLADDAEMDEYLIAYINGTLEQGLPTGLNGLNSFWMLKKHHLVWMAALDNVGKSFFVWYISVLAAKLHNWKLIINSGENGDGELRKKLMEFYMGKSSKVADDEELTLARDFIKDHFRIISSKQLHSIEEFLLKCEVIIDEGFEADCVVGEPYNSFDIDVNGNMHMINLKALNNLRVFKENYCSVWITDHIGTQAARKRDNNGYTEVPWKSDVDYGQLKCNKADDFLILHRLVNHPEQSQILQIHVNKVKSVETGGKPTSKDEPVQIQINRDLCGYTSNFIDPIKEYSKSKFA